MIKFTVHGVPAPQGSKVRNRYGGIREANKNTAPWRAAVTAKAAEVMRGRDILTGPVFVKAWFDFPRPKSHYGTGRNANVLKPGAPVYCDKKPDADKLARAIGDAITGVILRDDSQIVMWEIWKKYDTPARVDVVIEAA